MRLRKALALSAVLLATAAPSAAADIGTGGGARPAPALPSRVQASCGDGKSTAFPIGARIRGGPAVYRTGGGPQTWFLDLTNTTGSQCTAIHPVVVFTDKTRSLRPAHFRMEFEAPGGTFPVSLERTDRDEIIAVFDGGDAFPGFTVAAGGSLTVKVQLAFAPDTPLGEVVADAALVQRKGDDGEWVGEAGGYRFSVDGPEADEEEAPAAEAGSLAHTGRPREWAYGTAAVVALGAGGGLLLGARRLR
ncbi:MULTISPECIES: hypothetical protein [unclassified Streptomyces]|uniref:hypothetical protein n=1 Tax=unclassified Streptomyces TaxID=2593676 RepID=UPI001BEB523E|nr:MULTISPECIES: hypothetical protein [unclassified Streptomyces]MBT2402634.1 hypothetical protein [Streptomyces sp. ISL-21]MBT2457232.1 hypothetical protein [Streptomyces sp. ISL-86]MBT2608027.1 hypothetical protein [Streptomyces sp. ISL-87]